MVGPMKGGQGRTQRLVFSTDSTVELVPLKESANCPLANIYLQVLSHQ